MDSDGASVEENRPLSVLGLVPYPPDIAPSQRFRIEQWMPFLAEQGIAVELVPFVDVRQMKLLHQPGRLARKAAALGAASVRRAGHIARARRYDLVYVHRALCVAGPAVLERVLARLGRPILFDFDDAIFQLNTTQANRRFGWLKFPGKTAVICKLSAHVVVGNAWLGQYARRYNPRVTIIPSSVDLERYRPRPRPRPAGRGGRIVVGWTGSSTSQTYLEQFAPMLRELVARPDVDLRVHSDREPDLPGIPFVWRRWTSENEIEEISQFDVGIMPMPADHWTQGKCAMKALLYMALGIPAVCSDVGTNSELIEHGRNGLLARDRADWIGALGSLIDDPALRSRLGEAGRRSVEQHYSMRNCAGRFAAVVREVVIAGSPHARPFSASPPHPESIGTGR